MIYQVYHAEGLYSECQLDAQNCMPLAVGGATVWARSQGYLSSDVGDHVNDLNPWLNEWTAAYWLWRNPTLRPASAWVGLAHYRRPAPALLGNTSAVTPLLEVYGCLSWGPQDMSVRRYSDNYHPGAVDTLVNAISEVHGRGAAAAADVASSMEGTHPFANTFILRSDDYDAYCAWSWPMLESMVAAARQGRRLHRLFDLSTPRNIAYLTERLLPIWCMLSGKSVFYPLRVGVSHRTDVQRILTEHAREIT